MFESHADRDHRHPVARSLFGCPTAQDQTKLVVRVETARSAALGAEGFERGLSIRIVLHQHDPSIAKCVDVMEVLHTLDLWLRVRVR